MKKSILFLAIFLISSTLFAYVDSDMDGVEDRVDRCPNTPFSDLVDIEGCTKKSLISPHRFDVIVGASYSDSDYQTLNTTDTLASTIQLDYYYKDFSLQASTSYFMTSGDSFSDSGFYDSFVGAAYQLQALENLSLRVGVGIILPTYSTSLNNNNTDYTASLNLSYNISKYNLFAGYSYTQINDEDVSFLAADGNTTYINYQNTAAYSLGVGYYMSSSLYVSSAYNSSNSIYEGIEDIETLSLYGYYALDKNWFTTCTYAYGVSDSASKNYISLRLGYLF